MTSNARAGTRILGSLRIADGKGMVRIEDRFDTDIGDLWSALLLVLTKDADEPGEGAIEATLLADGEQTILLIEEPVPADLLAEYGAGIQVHVEDLAAHLAGRETCDAKARWDELISGYRDLAADAG
jgi:hypothetical protein